MHGGCSRSRRMLTILSALFDKYILRDNNETLDILDNLKRISSTQDQVQVPTQEVEEVVLYLLMMLTWLSVALCMLIFGHLVETYTKGISS